MHIYKLYVMYKKKLKKKKNTYNFVTYDICSYVL